MDIRENTEANTAEVKKELVLRRLRNNGNEISRTSAINDNTIFHGFNYTGNNCVLQNCEMGEHSYCGSNCNLYNTRIGKFACIGNNVKIIYGEHPTSTFVSVHPMFYSPHHLRAYTDSKVSRNKFNEYRYVDNHSAIIGNDVWICDNAMIIEGLTIGDGAVIAAGAVVTRNVEPYSIVAGNPAKIIKTRFDHEQISFLKSIKWWDKDAQWIKAHIDLFEDINEFMKDVLSDE